MKNEGLEWLVDDVGFVPNLNISVEKLAFHSFWNPSCVCRFMLVYVYIKPMYASPCLCTQAEGFFGLYFPKIDLFAHKKVIFSILTFLKSICNLIGP